MKGTVILAIESIIVAACICWIFQRQRRRRRLLSLSRNITNSNHSQKEEEIQRRIPKASTPSTFVSKFEALFKLIEKAESSSEASALKETLDQLYELLTVDLVESTKHSGRAAQLNLMSLCCSKMKSVEGLYALQKCSELFPDLEKDATRLIETLVPHIWQT